MEENNPIICAHKDAEKTGRACEHLLKNGNLEYYNSSEHFRFFTGRATVLLCSECAKDPEASEKHWKTICDSCVQDLAGGKRLGERGNPEVKRREAGLELTHKILSVEGPQGSVISATPRGIGGDGDWVLLNDRFELAVLRKGERSTRLALLPVHFNLEPTSLLSLVASLDGRFVAVCETYGRKGFVIDLAESRITMELLRGDYHNEH